ncbi:MAG: hypothetical protein JHC84_14525 [Solirubrobacteraceae bacterium]|nr:hypothetical protein [Solirubrobacteraceae bacterium]
MEVRATRSPDGLPVIALSGSAQAVDTSALLDQLASECDGCHGIVDVRGVPVMTSSLFGVLQAIAVRLKRDGSRLVVVCPQDDLPRLRAMRAGRDFALSDSVDGAQWELTRAPSRFQR